MYHLQSLKRYCAPVSGSKNDILEQKGKENLMGWNNYHQKLHQTLMQIWIDHVHNHEQ